MRGPRILHECLVCRMDFYVKPFPLWDYEHCTGFSHSCPELQTRWTEFDALADTMPNNHFYNPDELFNTWLYYQMERWNYLCSSCWQELREDYGAFYNRCVKYLDSQDNLLLNP
jgi:hypothetical protein